MRKHSVRKWLHAILDLLPVIILPIFAIYSHRHTIDSYEVTVPQNEVVNFNQQIKNGNFVNTDDWQVFNATLELSNDTGVIIKNNDTDYGVIFQDFTIKSSYSFLVKVDTLSFSSNNTYLRIACGDYNENITILGHNEFIFNVSSDAVRFHLYTFNGDTTLDNVQLFNLSYMFGVGNEPTLAQFNQWYTDDYYEYNTGTKQLLKGVSTVTYDNSDIGSQMIYSLYKPINDYFNLNNVFNFGAIYDWFELNMFNGNAPLSIYIVWNIIVYEFIMDIIFLIYSVFMFIIDFACETLDRFTGWAKRGD